MAPPLLPNAFYGTVQINGEPAPAGTQIEARGESVKTGISGNPVYTEAVGQYGSLGRPKLYVQGNIPEGKKIEFFINGLLAGEIAWHSGQQTEFNLAVNQG